jgi:hypothetical protein
VIENQNRVWRGGPVVAIVSMLVVEREFHAAGFPGGIN